MTDRKKEFVKNLIPLVVGYKQADNRAIISIHDIPLWIDLSTNIAYLVCVIGVLADKFDGEKMLWATLGYVAERLAIAGLGLVLTPPPNF